MCTRFIIKALDGSPLYGRTMKWAGFDLNSELVLKTRGTSFTSAPSAEKSGMTWESRFGFISFNPAKLPNVVMGRMNETGLTIGVLYLPGFAQHQELVEGKEVTPLERARQHSRLWL